MVRKLGFGDDKWGIDDDGFFVRRGGYHHVWMVVSYFCTTEGHQQREGGRDFGPCTAFARVIL